MRLAVALALAACGDNREVPVDAPGEAPPECPVRGTKLAMKRIAYGCEVEGAPAAPNCIDRVATLVTSPPDDPRLFAIELWGRIRLIENGVLSPQPFLDLSEDAGGPVKAADLTELGLLGLAFHPQFATNRELFVFYTANNPDRTDTAHPYVDVLARYTARADDPSKADPSSGVVVLSILDSWSNHNGGMIEFGADGLLYLSTGDGGGVSIDSNGQANGQDPQALLGKVLRIDVDQRGTAEYGIPADNPFANGVAGAKEVFVLGLRNPWRWSFDRATGDMWIGDVGQARIEELDVLFAGEQAGKNLGWAAYEGAECFNGPCNPAGLTLPLDSRDHAAGWWAITGGQVYRGACYPDLVGSYFYSDTGYGRIARAKLRADRTLDVDEPALDFYAQATSLHADSRGELFETDVAGNIWQLVVEP